MSHNIKNILSIDVEDYFQINAFADVIKYADWDSFESRVEKNTLAILNLLESTGTEDGGRKSEVRGQKSENGNQRSEVRGQKSETLNYNKQQTTNDKHTKKVRGTFFVLGWIAGRFPDLVKEIHKRGHEVACHGYAHQLIFKQDRDTFRDDVKRAKDILENITGTTVLGYRAPTYTITERTMWALEILHELGFKYDSSIFPINHDVYGYPGAPRFPYCVLLNDDSSCNFIMENDLKEAGNHAGDKFVTEFPISTYRIFNKNVPVGGGGYFRLFPYMITKTLLKRINKKEDKPFVFYLHPWEIDPGIPKMDKAGKLSKFRTYVNLDKTFGRLEKLIRDFDFTCFADIIKKQKANQDTPEEFASHSTGQADKHRFLGF